MTDHCEPSMPDQLEAELARRLAFKQAHVEEVIGWRGVHSDNCTVCRELDSHERLLTACRAALQAHTQTGKKDEKQAAFKAGYHCRWVDRSRYVFDPELTPGDSDGAWLAYQAHEIAARVPAPAEPQQEVKAAPMSTDLEHIAGFCEQTAADGIYPSRAWFSETAATLRQLPADAEAALIAHTNTLQNEVITLRAENTRLEQALARIRMAL